MRLILFAHPEFLGSLSMPRFARMLADGYRARGHAVEVWSPQARAYKLRAPRAAKKWLGYVDQYILFPRWVRRQLLLQAQGTLYVFTDQALGPWVPLVADRPHVIHCHDFLAQRSALGEIPLNPTKWSGRRYQAYIRNGYRKGKHFISISEATRLDLHRMMGEKPPVSKVVYNGLNGAFAPLADAETRPPLRYLLHVGGNQWYKNRAGVLKAYAAYCLQVKTPLTLIMVGGERTPVLRELARTAPMHGRVEFRSNVAFADLLDLYQRATLLFFPSLAEGFGWPIAEAQACGCPVITSDAAPMTEVGGAAARYVPVCPAGDAEAERAWAQTAAAAIAEVAALPPEARAEMVQKGIANAQRFDTAKTLDRYLAIYERALAQR